MTRRPVTSSRHGSLLTAAATLSIVLLLGACSDDDTIVLDGPAEVDDTGPVATTPVGPGGGNDLVGGTGTLTASVDGVDYAADATICEVTPNALVAEGTGVAPDGTPVRISVTRTPDATGEQVAVAVVVADGTPAWSTTTAAAGADLTVVVGERSLSGTGPATDLGDPDAPAATLEFDVRCD